MRVLDDPAMTNPKPADSELAPTKLVRAAARDRLKCLDLTSGVIRHQMAVVSEEMWQRDRLTTDDAARWKQAAHSVHCDCAARYGRPLCGAPRRGHETTHPQACQRARLARRRASKNCEAVPCSPRRTANSGGPKREITHKKTDLRADFKERCRTRSVRNAQQSLSRAHVHSPWHCDHQSVRRCRNGRDVDTGGSLGVARGHHHPRRRGTPANGKPGRGTESEGSGRLCNLRSLKIVETTVHTLGADRGRA